MLKNVLARYKANPIVKQTLGRGEPPSNQDAYDALQVLLRDDDLRDFVDRADIYLGDMIDRPFVDSSRYHGIITDIAQQLSRAARGRLTARAKKQIREWVHNNTLSARISPDVITEIGIVDGIRPTEQTTLYRGMLFQNWQMKDPMWRGASGEREQHPKSARMFLDALQHGHTEMLLGFAEPSSWTTRLDIANRFATKRAATSHHAAMLNWLHNMDKHIDGKLGVIISAVMIPRDILCDVSKIDIGHLGHGDEGEMIIRAGNYRVEIHNIYTQQGEIDVSEFANWLNTNPPK